jgi:hypothetical protein
MDVQIKEFEESDWKKRTFEEDFTLKVDDV